VVARLKIDIPVVEDTGSAAPSGKAAHVRSTGWPGGGTNIYLYADAKKGTFLNLWKAKVGDTIDLHLVDGSVATYVVTKILPKVPSDQRGDQYLLPTPAEQLTLQTAAAGWKRAGDPNFIVIAVPK